jgi:hypothetical protein
MRDTDYHGASIGEEIIDAVGYGDAGGVRAEIVIIDLPDLLLSADEAREDKKTAAASVRTCRG